MNGRRLSQPLQLFERHFPDTAYRIGAVFVFSHQHFHGNPINPEKNVEIRIVLAVSTVFKRVLEVEGDSMLGSSLYRLRAVKSGVF